MAIDAAGAVESEVLGMYALPLQLPIRHSVSQGDLRLLLPSRVFRNFGRLFFCQRRPPGELSRSF